MSTEANRAVSNPSPGGAGRFLYRSLLAFFLVIGIGLTVLSFIDLDFLRRPVTEAVSDIIGMDVTVETVNLSFDRGITLKGTGIGVRSRADGKNIATAREIVIDADWLPLLQGRVQVNRAVFVEPAVHIAVHAEKPAIAEPDVAAVPAPETPVAPPSSAPDDIPAWFSQLRKILNKSEMLPKTIEVRNGKLEIPLRGKRPEIDLSFATHIVRDGERLSVDFEIIEAAIGNLRAGGIVLLHDVFASAPAIEAKLALREFSEKTIYELRDWFPEKQRQWLDKRPFTAVAENLALKATVPVRSMQNGNRLLSDIEGELAAGLSGFSFRSPAATETAQPLLLDKARIKAGKTAAKGLDLEINVRPAGGGEAVLAYHAGHRLKEPAAAELKLSAIPGASLQPFLPERTSLGTLNGFIRWSIKSSDNLFPLPESALDIFAPESARSEISLQAKPATLNLAGTGLEVEQLEASGKGGVRASEFDIRAGVKGGSLRLAGTMSFPHVDADSGPTLQSRLELKHFNLAALRPPKENDVSYAGNVTGEFTFALPVKHTARASWIGSMEGSDLTLTRAGSAKSIKRLTLRSIELASVGGPGSRVEYQLLDSHFAENVAFQKIYGDGVLSPRGLRPFHAHLFPAHGQIDAQGEYRAEDRGYHLDVESANLAVEDFTGGRMTGTMTFGGALSGNIESEHPARRLSGNARFRLADGAIQNVEFYSALLTLLNPHTALDKGMPYKSMSGDFKIADGIVTTHNLEMDGPQLKMLAAAKMDLESLALQGEVKAMPLQLVDTIVKAIPLLGGVLTGGKKGGLIETYFAVSGTLLKPKFKLQPGKTLLGKPVDVIEQIIKLPQTLTGGDADQPTQ